MAGQKITDLARLSTLSNSDQVLIVDVSDSTMAPTGTTKRILASDLHAGLQTAIDGLDSSTQASLDSLTSTVSGLSASIGGFQTAVDTSLATAQAYTDATPSATTVAGASYTFGTADATNTIVETTSGSNQTLTVPPVASVAFPTGAVIEVARMGAGTVTFAPGAGVTLQAVGGTVITSQYGVATLRRRSSNTWHLVTA